MSASLSVGKVGITGTPSIPEHSYAQAAEGLLEVLLERTDIIIVKQFRA